MKPHLSGRFVSFPLVWHPSSSGQYLQLRHSAYLSGGRLAYFFVFGGLFCLQLLAAFVALAFHILSITGNCQIALASAQFLLYTATLRLCEPEPATPTPNPEQAPTKIQCLKPTFPESVQKLDALVASGHADICSKRWPGASLAASPQEAPSPQVRRRQYLLTIGGRTRRSWGLGAREGEPKVCSMNAVGKQAPPWQLEHD